MENRHHYKYVIIDSSKENQNSVDAKFKVQIPQGITGTTRVCVKSFSMPNSYHNIYGDLKTLLLLLLLKMCLSPKTKMKNLV